MAGLLFRSGRSQDISAPGCVRCGTRADHTSQTFPCDRPDWRRLRSYLRPQDGHRAAECACSTGSLSVWVVFLPKDHFCARNEDFLHPTRVWHMHHDGFSFIFHISLEAVWPFHKNSWNSLFYEFHNVFSLKSSCGYAFPSKKNIHKLCRLLSTFLWIMCKPTGKHSVST